MSTTTLQHRKKATYSTSKRRAAQLLRELPEEKIQVALPFLEFLKFIDRNGDDKEFDLTDSIKRGLGEVAQIKMGKLRGKSLGAFLDEL